MSGYWCDEGELDVISDYLESQNLYLGLITAPTEGSLAESMTTSDLTEVTPESGGYARQQLALGDWTKVASVASQPFKQFDIATEVTVLGYFITDQAESTSGELLLGVCYFNNPITISAGDYLQVKVEIEVK